MRGTVWTAILEVGHPCIDTQHKAILSTLNALHSCIQADLDSNIIGAIVNREKQQLHEHFTYELRILEQTGQLAKHDTESHHHISNMLNSLLVQANELNYTECLIITENLIDSFVSHVLEESDLFG